MYYSKNYALPKPSRKNILLSSFKGYDETKVSTTLPCDYVDCVYNYKFKNGRLVNPYGINELKIGENILPDIPEIEGEKRLFCTKTVLDKKLTSVIVISHQNGLEYMAIGENIWHHIDNDYLFTNAVNYLYEDKDLLILSGEKGLKIFDNGALNNVEQNNQIIDMCVHYERIYTIVKGERNSLWFSDDFDPYNWNVSIDEGGYINFDGTLGNVNAIKSFINYLFIFCDYGIYRLTAFADQNQFSMKKVYTSCGRIFSKSVTECGEYIAFASEDGVYLFDGYDVTRYSIKANDLLGEGIQDVSACYAHHKYILSFTNNIDSNYGVFSQPQDNNLLLIFDLSDKSVNLMRGLNFDNLMALSMSDYNRIIGLSKDTACVSQLDDTGLYFGFPFQKYWQSGEIDFDTPSVTKVIRSIEYSTKHQYVFGIIANGLRQEFVLSPEETKKNLYIKSQSFVFYIRSDNKAEDIRPPKLVVDYLAY